MLGFSSGSPKVSSAAGFAPPGAIGSSFILRPIFFTAATVLSTLNLDSSFMSASSGKNARTSADSERKNAVHLWTAE
jgi:hypothetical protein